MYKKNTKSMTVAKLIKELKKQPQSWMVYTAVDPEGNAFGSLDKTYLIGGSNKDKVVVIHPIETHMDDEIMPLEMAEIMKGIK